MSIPRPEHPRPQFVRSEWLNLNGEWQFEIDWGDSGLERGLREREFEDRILVPFCPEAPLSGIGCVDFMNAVWYRRTVTIPEEWAGRRVLVHFQAVDYDTTVWVNGREVGRHRGGFTPFTCDLSGVAPPGQEATLVVRARDSRGAAQARGKQSQRYRNHGCLYTRTTGIWQTVWLEAVPQRALLRPRWTPDVSHGCLHLQQPVTRGCGGLRLRVRLTDDEGEVTAADCLIEDFSPNLSLEIPPSRRHLWSPGEPHLYQAEISLLDENGAVVDCAQSYAGLRSITIDGRALLINGERIFQRLVLDQGYYPDGIMTAPSDEALRGDIELSIQAGFNGARLHQKVFEERFLYHADRLGYLVWGEFGDWGCRRRGPDDDHIRPPASFITEWLEALERDYSHPCIVGWCPLNETRQPITDRITVLDEITRGMFLAAKSMDLTRPVLDASGYAHRVAESDIYDCHSYQQDAAQLAEQQAGLSEGKPYSNNPDWSIPYGGQPFFVSEFGGIWWNPQAAEEEDSWGYGNRPKTIEEFYQRFQSLCDVLLDNEEMFGYCYTQLTDVYQEQNGIYTFDRETKFDLERLRGIQQRPAAFEPQPA